MPVAVANPHLEVQVLVARVRLELDLVHLEAEFIEAADAVGDPVALVVGDALSRGDLVPERPVARRHLLAEAEIGLVQRAALGGGEVGHLGADVLDHDPDVLGPAAVGEEGPDRRSLGVDEDRLQRRAVVPVEHVAERAVAPDAAVEVELDEEAGQGIDQPRPDHSRVSCREDLAVGNRAVGEARDQEGGSLGAGIVVGADGQPDRAHRGSAPFLQKAEHLVVAPRRLEGQLLDRVGHAAELDEADLVA